MAAITPGGIAFLDADNALFRAFRHQRTARSGFDQPWIWIEDLDGDRNREFVGAGRPAFVLDHNADPIWGIPGGCEQFFLGDFTQDRGLQILCRNGNRVEIHSHDGQRIFVWEGRGYRLGQCWIDDFSSNRKLDLACESGSNHLFFDFRFDGPEEREGGAPDTMARGAANLTRTAALARGDRPLDLGGRQVTLAADGGELRITAADDGAVLARHTFGGEQLHSAAVVDLGHGPRLYIGDDRHHVHVFGADGEHLASVNVDPAGLRRDARVQVRRASANRIEDASRETVEGIFAGALDRFTQCYASRMGEDQTTRVGSMVAQLTIDGGGRVTEVQRRHSDLRSAELDGCIERELRSLRFSSATEGTGIASITLDFDFVDRR
ncbi:MAG: hypothetical protein EA398_04870 [Deltaproteobacteria bacterium]|nr:MAG: hypothetical protein EA398_04870 [Deltaproteobacteria bacterium]